MATKIIKTIFQFRRDTAANWETNKGVKPAAGEPCYDLDNKTLRIGDGNTTYENLPVIGEVNISGDGKSISYEDGTIELVGFEDAPAGSQLTKGADGNVTWVAPDTNTVDGLSQKLTDVENAIATLNGEGEGSIAQAVADGINDFATKVDNTDTVDTFKELVDYVAEHAPQAADMAADIQDLKSKVGDSSVSSQVESAISDLSVETGAQVNVIESVSINNVEQTVSDKNVNIPVGGDALGVVKQSTEITINNDGALGVGEISFDKITAGTETVIFDGGSSSDLV